MEKEIPRLSRLTSIILMLQSKRVLTASEIAEKFEISIRTVYRDIKALEESGVPIFNEERKGYSLMDGFNLPPIMLTEEEANTLITIEKIISLNSDTSLIQNYQNVTTKIKAILKYSQKEKIELLSERIGFTTQKKEQTKSNSLSLIQISITNQKAMEIEYQSISKEEITVREVEPQGIYFTNENWIMIAWCKLRNNYREFRLDRILNTKPLEKQLKNRNFNLSAYFFQVSEKHNSIK